MGAGQHLRTRQCSRRPTIGVGCYQWRYAPRRADRATDHRDFPTGHDHPFLLHRSHPAQPPGRARGLLAVAERWPEGRAIELVAALHDQKMPEHLNGVHGLSLPMKNLLTQIATVCAVATLGASAAFAAEAGATTTKGRRASQSREQALLLDFTGSDWCPGASN